MNTSSADNALRVYSWKTSRIDGSLETDIAQLLDQFMDIREERHILPSGLYWCICKDESLG
jgi:hypothetical protein